MPKKLQKTLSGYLLKMKNPHPQIQLSKSWILSGCKHPKTPSFALEGRNISSSSSHPGSGTSNNHNHNHNHNHKKDDAATLADVDRFLFENFKSLYFEDDDETENNNMINTKRISEDQSHDEEAAPPKLASFLFDSPRLFMEPPPDLCGSPRFFVKPGISGSLLEDSLTTSDEAGSSKSTTSTTTLNGSPSKEVMDHHHGDHAHTLPDNCVALLTHSASPYEDFRRSMQDVVEARYGNINNNNNHQRVIDWDFMEELLFCYLNLNEKKSHKFILSAFVDLITVMRRNSETAPAKPRSVRTVRIGREVRKKTKEVTIEFGSS